MKADLGSEAVWSEPQKHHQRSYLFAFSMLTSFNLAGPCAWKTAAWKTGALYFSFLSSYNRLVMFLQFLLLLWSLIFGVHAERRGCHWSCFGIRETDKQNCPQKSTANFSSHCLKLCRAHCQPVTVAMLLYLGWNYANLLILEPHAPAGLSQGRDVTAKNKEC